MKALVPIKIFNIDISTFDGDDENQQNIIETEFNDDEVGNGAYRSILSLLDIYILNEGEAVLNPSHQYSICLYIEKESYNSLSTVSAKFSHELEQLKEGYKASDGTIWPIELFFSGDWKFVALILGINAATSNYFCLYCNCHKDECHNMDKVWLNLK
ncbi:hypothetical protein RhiirA4_464003 [Rhizophagus irregularis]|uniref:Uncharacterized protein n=1 Tax=Rhizophagus irregularis TaxID=588596 RepID=A0A2I1GP43_9GLOM|nr:hypothetical protein RhiirA4_464003 [Rhizophagus irregularis]